MSAFRDLANLRVNFFILFVGAFIVIFLIKLTSLLPAQYYFNFSKLFGSDTSPFLMDPPSVSTEKLCTMLKKNRIDPDSLPGVGDCKEKEVQQAQILSKDQVDLVYELAFKTDASINAGFRQAAGSFTMQPMQEKALNEILSRSGSPRSAFFSLRYEVGKQISDHFAASLGPQIASVYVSVRDPKIKPRQEVRIRRLTDPGRALVREAYQAFLTQFDTLRLGEIAIKPIKKSYLDENSASMYSKEGVQGIVSNYYVTQYSEPVTALLRRAFEEKRLVWNDQKKKEILFQAITEGGLANYGVAIAVRVLPVLIFGFVLGILFGRQELFSIALAAAFAAFLLSWPVILLWDTVVQSSWADKKQTFLIFYLLYMVAFFFTARVGAMFGILFRRALPESLSVSSGEATVTTISAVSAKELAINLFVGVLVNGVVYAWNVIIPLSA